MDLAVITQDLNRRFAAPLPEFYRRRIIFWYDEDHEFADKLDDFVLDNAKLFVLTGTNHFQAKQQITRIDSGSNYLVYCPYSYEKLEDDWLLDMKLYSEEFRADLVSIWMNEIGLPATPAMRGQVKNYYKFFNAKDRRSRIMKMPSVPASPSQLHLAVMAVCCGQTDAQPASIIRGVILGGSELSNNKPYQNLKTYGADTAFWSLVSQGTGYSEEKPDLGRLLTHILLTASTRTLSQEYLAGLDSYISTPHQAFCYDLVYEWLHADEGKELYPLARFVEDEARLYQRFMGVPIENLMETECFPCINEVILTRLMKDITNDLIDTELIRKVVEKRRTCVWYGNVENFYSGIAQVSLMFTFFKEHAAGFHTVEPAKVWKEYTQDYYLMDTYYRRFQLAFQRSLTASNALLDDLFKSVVEKVEGLYSHWFLGELGNNWSRMCADELAEYGRILEIPQQIDFYRSRVKSADNRIFVIISDAMRYEVAVELAGQLRQETQSKVELSSMEGIFPTITKCGMAALLPHKSLSVEDKGGFMSVYADGMSTDSGNRDAVLKAANPKSVALKYKDLISMKRSERTEAMKGKNVVYIYHNKIDETSHTSDTEVFSACEDTIAEIKNLIRVITGDYGQGNFLITADHGFLYTYSPLQEDSKVSKESWNGNEIEYGRRYAVMRKGAEPEYLLPVKFLDGKTDFEGFAPRESIRIKMNGGGMNFVHGGISLQEMCVPVIEYHHLRNSYAEYKKNKNKYDTKLVTVALLSANRKISNMIFSLNFYQKEAVGANREAANYLLYFVDKNGQKISDEQKIIADKTGNEATERTFRCSFNLKSMQYKSTEIYYLVIADETGLQMPVKEEFQIDIAFALDDFNFFG